MQALRWAAGAYAAAVAVHGLDHLRRGLDASPWPVIAGGTLQFALVAVILWMVQRGHPRAAAVAAGLAVAFVAGFALAHLAPTTWPAFSDSYVSPPRTNVTWMSWTTAVAEVGTGIALALIATRALIARRRAA